MGFQIIKQPDGKYAGFCSISDAIIGTDLSREEIIDHLVKEKLEDITRKVNDVCDQLDAGEKPYFQFTMTWEEAKRTHEEHHGPFDKETT